MTASDPSASAESLVWLGELFQANVDAAFNVAYRLVWNRADAQDVVQSSLLKAARGLGQLRDPGKARPWLLAITYREALMVLRSRRDVPTDPVEFPDLVGASPSAEDIVAQQELIAVIQAAIDGLPLTLRTAIVLRDVEEFPMADVADILAIGLSAAKMRVARAREAMRATLTGRI